MIGRLAAIVDVKRALGTALANVGLIPLQAGHTQEVSPGDHELIKLSPLLEDDYMDNSKLRRSPVELEILRPLWKLLGMHRKI